MRFELKTLAMAAVVIVIAVAAVLLLTGGTPTITTNSTLSLARNASYNFHLAGDRNVSSVQVVSTSATNSTVYLGRSPLLINDVLVLHLSRGQSENVSLSGSSNADLNVMLESSTPQAATLVLTYVPAGLGVKVSSGVVLLSAVESGTLPSTSASYSNTTTQSTSTIAAAGTTTVAPTTIAVQVNSTAQAIREFNATKTGIMINEFGGILVSQNNNCTARGYYNEFFGSGEGAPTGAQTFANISRYVPQRIISGGVKVGNNLYNISYTEVVAAGNKPFALVQYDTSGNFTNFQKFYVFGENYNAEYYNYTTLAAETHSDKCAIFLGAWPI